MSAESSNPSSPSPWLQLSWYGRNGLSRIQMLGRWLLFGLSAGFVFFQTRAFWRRWATAINEIGVRCLFIVLTIAVFSGMVLGLQGYYTLVKFGSEGLLGPAVALTIIRELGPVLTAIMIVAQAGSALTAEIGMQRHSEQIDALETMRIHPLGFLVSHRLWAAVLVYPILTVVFDIVGIYGGYLTGVVLMHLDAGVYFSGIRNSVNLDDILGGLLKASIFGVITVLICTFEGFFTHLRSKAKGSRGVSESTTRAVVIASIAILAADYVLTSFLI